MEGLQSSMALAKSGRGRSHVAAAEAEATATEAEAEAEAAEAEAEAEAADMIDVCPHKHDLQNFHFFRRRDHKGRHHVLILQSVIVRKDEGSARQAHVRLHFAMVLCHQSAQSKDVFIRV